MAKEAPEISIKYCGNDSYIIYGKHRPLSKEDCLEIKHLAESYPASEIGKLIKKYIASSLKSVEACIKQYPDSAPKYKPLMKTRGELKQILRALK